MQRVWNRIFHRGAIGVAWLLFLSTLAVLGADTATNNFKSTNDISGDVNLRAYLQLQEKVHEAMLAIETNRNDARNDLQRNAEVVSARLKRIEETLSEQSEAGVDAMQKSNRMVMITAGIFGGVGLLAMIITAIFLFHTMNRLAEISTVIPKNFALGPGNDLAGADGALVTMPAENTRLLGAIERLDKRIQEMEVQASSPQLLGMAKSNGNGKHQTIVAQDGTAAKIETTTPGQDRVNMILGKGQTLLNLGQAENALVCFDEVLETDPDHAEALVKKGTALERLRRWDEALKCYDRAIASDNAMTLAYLYKGGVYNQLERFSEALECYEQALRTQQRAPVAVG
jgi:tetratricopeptide (TPR) repeat protein